MPDDLRRIGVSERIHEIIVGGGRLTIGVRVGSVCLRRQYAVVVNAQPQVSVKVVLVSYKTIQEERLVDGCSKDPRNKSN